MNQNITFQKFHTSKILTCKNKENLENKCCCWIRAAIPNTTWGHTYTFNPIQNPVITIRLDDITQTDLTKTHLWIKRGIDPNPETGWETRPTTTLNTDQNNSKTIAIAIKGTVSGVQIGSPSTPLPTTSIGLCSPFDPKKIETGTKIEIPTDDKNFEQQVEDTCKQFTEPPKPEKCTINTVLQDTGIQLPESIGPVPIGDTECNAFTTLLLGGGTVGGIAIFSLIQQGTEALPIDIDTEDLPDLNLQPPQIL